MLDALGKGCSAAIGCCWNPSKSGGPPVASVLQRIAGVETVCIESSGFTFAIPPSLGRFPARALARRFAELLWDAGFSRIIPLTSYADMARAILQGEVDAAWAPPLVCAMVERAGGRVAVRARRYGQSWYRSALLSHACSDIDLERLHSGGPHRAAWVSRWSMGGYLLPRHYLRSNGIDPAGPKVVEMRVGSYEDCFHAVLRGEADIAATFVTPGADGQVTPGYLRVCGGLADHLRVFAYTDACPNDGIVLAPHLTDADADAMTDSLRAVTADPRHHELAVSIFEAEGFDVPAPHEYASVLDIVSDPAIFERVERYGRDAACSM